MKNLFLILFIIIIASFSVNEAFADDLEWSQFGPVVEITVDETNYKLYPKLLSGSVVNLEDEIYSPTCLVIIDDIPSVVPNYPDLDLEYRMTVTDVYANHDLDNYLKQVGPIRFQSTDYDEPVPLMKFNNGYFLKVKCEIWDKDNPSNYLTSEHIVPQLIDITFEPSIPRADEDITIYCNIQRFIPNPIFTLTVKYLDGTEIIKVTNENPTITLLSDKSLLVTCTIDSISTNPPTKRSTTFQTFEVILVDEAFDSDGDGLTDGEEIHNIGTNPGLEDTDGGGIDDGTEVNICGTDPLDSTDDYDCTINDSDNKKKNGACADCTPPTLGLTVDFKRVVDNGFSYNYNPVDVQKWYTPFPLINATVGKLNTVDILVYENNGIHNMRMVQFGLGATHLGQPLHDLEVLIEVPLISNGSDDFIETGEINIRDPDNLIYNDSVMAHANVTECIDDIIIEECVRIRIHYSYRENTINSMMVVSASDKPRNSQLFYFNHGVQVLGDSVNEPPTYILHNKQTNQQTENLTLTLTRTDKINHIWEDENKIEYLKISEDRFDRITPAAPWECNDPSLDEVNVPTRNNCNFRALVSFWNN